MKNRTPDKPWITSFSSIVKPVLNSGKDKYLSEASVNKLKKFIPEIDTYKNSDLLPIAFNAYVANRVNANDDLVSADTAIAMKNGFINKPINVEHNRNHIIGCILKSGFSRFGSDEPFEEDELIDYLLTDGIGSPFNSTLGGVLWRIAGEGISNYIEEASDPSSQNYNAISASWEVSFSEFNILMLPEGAKNVSEGQIVSDDSEIEKMMDSLKGFGGSGKYNNQRIYRLIVGEVTPLGVGLTETPAADVKGILSQKDGLEAMVEDNNASEANIEDCKSLELNLNNDSKDSGNFVLVNDLGLIKKESHSNIEEKIKNNCVNISKDHSIMKIKDLKDITDDKLQAGEIKASVISDFVESKLEQASEEYSEQKNALNKSVSEAQALAETLKQENEQIQKDLQDSKDAIANLQGKLAAKEAEEAFNSRMQVIAEKFNLSETQEKAIAKEIKAIDSDEAFAAYLDRISLFVSEKKTEKEAAASVSTEKVVSDAIDNGETKKTAVASQSTEQPTLLEKAQKAFNIKVTGGKIQL